MKKTVLKRKLNGLFVDGCINVIIYSAKNGKRYLNIGIEE